LFFKVHRKTIDKVLSQNLRLDKKIDTLINGQKILEDRILDLEKLINNNNDNNNNIQDNPINNVIS